MTSILDKITFIPLPDNQYYKEEFNKTQIYLHHTASPPDPMNPIGWWKTTPERVGVAFIIAGKPRTEKERSLFYDGQIFQVFSSKYWAHHLGCTVNQLKAGGPGVKTNTQLNKMSIGIEICNWGYLTDGLTYQKTKLPEAEIIELETKYRGYKFYQQYTDAQLQSVKELVQFLGDKYNIPLTYKGDKIFNICPEALRGEAGIWTHTSVRPDKFDCFPQPSLIEMLKTL